MASCGETWKQQCNSRDASGRSFSPVSGRTASCHGSLDTSRRLDTKESAPSEGSSGWVDFPLDSTPSDSSRSQSFTQDISQVTEDVGTITRPINICITNGNFICDASSGFQLEKLVNMFGDPSLRLDPSFVNDHCTGSSMTSAKGTPSSPIPANEAVRHMKRRGSISKYFFQSCYLAQKEILFWTKASSRNSSYLRRSSENH
ncbi:uncharacterized protein LOC144098842 isoform X2 [Amblyomma americanum]